MLVDGLDLLDVIGEIHTDPLVELFRKFVQLIHLGLTSMNIPSIFLCFFTEKPKLLLHGFSFLSEKLELLIFDFHPFDVLGICLDMGLNLNKLPWQRAARKGFCQIFGSLVLLVFDIRLLVFDQLEVRGNSVDPFDLRRKLLAGLNPELASLFTEEKLFIVSFQLRLQRHNLGACCLQLVGVPVDDFQHLAESPFQVRDLQNPGS
mmetsp:Transcript_31897/g.73209  ORF Transcript_31897/g.73209 Transcript_31897/m.73209 type:complete len:205 (-) Transcript_31897:106-720(-)